MPINAIIFCALSLLLPPMAWASSDDAAYESIVTLGSLLEAIDDRYAATPFEDQGAAFTHYYSAPLDRSFLVDEELGRVCKTYKGRTILSCFPCGADEVSEQCP